MSDQRSHATPASSSSHDKSRSGQELLELRTRTNGSRRGATILSGLEESEFHSDAIYAEINEAEVVSFAETPRTNDIVNPQVSPPDLQATQHGEHHPRFTNSRRERSDFLTGGEVRRQQHISFRLVSPEDVEPGGQPAHRQTDVLSQDLPEIVCPNCEKRPQSEHHSLPDEPEGEDSASELMAQGPREVTCWRL